MNVPTRMTAAGPGAETYRFDHPRIADIMHDMYVREGELGPGDPAGSFDLPTTEGGRVSSADLPADGRPLLIIFGSRTCPVTESAVDGLRRLHALHGDHVQFVMLQVREAHPGACICQPRTFAEKCAHAVNLKDHHRLPFEVAVDDLDGTLHRRFGSRPNSLYVISPSGTIAFRAQWANQTAAISEALVAVTEGRPVPVQAVTRTLRAIMDTLGYMSPVLRAAGPGAGVTPGRWRPRWV